MSRDNIQTTMRNTVIMAEIKCDYKRQMQKVHFETSYHTFKRMSTTPPLFFHNRTVEDRLYAGETDS